MPLNGPVKLTYFDARGRAEVLRLIMKYGKINFEDVRLQFSDWPAVKPNSPWGGAPFMEINGQKVGQGMALTVFLAKETGLYSDNAFEALRMDEVLNAREDMIVAESKPMFEKDEAKKAEFQKKLVEEVYPTTLGKFNSMIKDNKSGWTVGVKMSMADIVIFEGTQTLSEHMPKILDNFPEVKAVREKVKATPGIKEYLATRGQTIF